MPSTPPPPIHRRAVATIVALLAASALASCDTGDGRALRPPTEAPPTSSTTLPPPDPAGLGGGDPGGGDPGGGDPSGGEPDPGGVLPGPAGIGLFTPWREGAEISSRHGCAGIDVSPPLAWSGIPDDAVEVAISMIDEQAEGLVHWLVVGIDPSFTSVPEGGLPPGARPLVNSFGTEGWTGPCPPEGTTHGYRIMVHALAQQLEGVDDLTADEAVALIDQLTVEFGVGTGTATR